MLCGRPRRAAPILRGSRPGSSDLPTAQRFPLAAGEEACATCDRASNHVRLQRFTVRERCIPGLGESVGLVWPSDGPSDDRSPNRGRRDCKNHRDDDPRPLVVVRGLCRRCDLGVLACVGSADVCHSDPPRDDMREEVGLSAIGVHPRNGGLRRVPNWRHRGLMVGTGDGSEWVL